MSVEPVTGLDYRPERPGAEYLSEALKLKIFSGEAKYCGIEFFTLQE